MSTPSPSDLLDWLGQYQFLSAAQMDEIRPLLPTFPDRLAFVKELMARDWLTPYQVNQIMQGKGDQLVWDCYRLRERIGEGAMGQVFKAWSLRLERIVAIKTISKELINSAKAMERFYREVQTAAQLDHPNIALVRDAGEAEGRPFLVMDFIDGIDLSRRVKQQGALPIHEAAEYARQAALGLQYAFERGIVHRDIKPANLMVTRKEWLVASGQRLGPATSQSASGGLPTNLVKILDFGLARYESERESGVRLTQVGKLLGTIDYVAPEQAQDARGADIRADIYSLGCSLFYMLAGQAPFQGKDIVEKLGPRLTGEPPWVRSVRPEVPPGLEEVVRKMMARRPEDRYQTPIEAALALQPYTEAPLAPLPALATLIASEGMSQRVPTAVVMAIPVPADAVVPGANLPMAQPVYDPVQMPPLPALSASEGTSEGMSSDAITSEMRVPSVNEGIPVASPVFLPTPREEGRGGAKENAAFLNMTASGRDMSQPNASPNAVSPTRKQGDKTQATAATPKKPLPVKPIVILGGGAFLFCSVLCLGACLFGFFWRDRPKTSDGILRIAKAKWSMPDEKAIPGNRHHVLVWIERVHCKGPVKITLKDLPDGVTSTTSTIQPGGDSGQVGFVVSFDTDPLTKEVKVVAECEADGATAEIPMTLIVKEDPQKVKKK
jgi:serine/threonine-protein kinase